MRSCILAIVLCTMALPVFAQNWTRINPARLDGDRRIITKESVGFRVSSFSLRNLLLAAPHENRVRAEDSPTKIRIPLPDGKSAVFRIVAYDISPAVDLARYPNIRTWYGVNTRKPSQTIFLDWTERGFHASVSGGGEASYYIDPLFRGDIDHYQVYYRSNATPAAKENFYCKTLPTGLSGDLPATEKPKSVGDCSLLQYIVAIATTPAYSNYHGATSEAQASLVQSSIVTSVNRLNQIFTRDLSLRLQLIAGNDRVYFYDEETNPYSGNTVSILINDNIKVLNQRLGQGNYALGHVYTLGGNNGLARLRSSCGIDAAAGVTSHSRPEGDPFNVDYVAHEMGHQLGANHTQNNSCNYSSSAGMEPGSASTIMGYAGICAPNIQSNSDDYFHGRSIEEITNWLEESNGGSCASIISENIKNPIIAPISNYLVPIGTPLKLSGSASGNGSISYNWEQYDAEQAVMPPKGDNASGPLFRSFPAQENGDRYLPQFRNVIDGVDPMWEELPMVDREVNFRLTVQNTNATYGCASEKDVSLQVSGANGPFVVTDPNNENQWSRGQIAQVRWDVAGTDDSLFHSPTVAILLTTNGGTSFDTLLHNTPNDGLAEVLVPNRMSENARILVRSIDNIFYNLTEKDFTIGDSTGVPEVALNALSSTGLAGCFVNSDSATFKFLTSSINGASAALELRIDDLPEGTRATFSPDSVRPGGRFEVIIRGVSSLNQGNYEATIIGSSNEGTKFSQAISLTKLGNGNVPGPLPIYPIDLASDTRPQLEAEDTNADFFEIQLSEEEDFSTLLFNTTQPLPRFTPSMPLSPNTRYYWRIRGMSAQSGCGATNWAIASFVSGACYTFKYEGAPAVIGSGLPPQIAELPIEVPISGEVTDVDLLQLDVAHSFVGDLEIDLVGPDATTIPLFNRNCSSNDNLLFSFDDEANSSAYFCPPVNPDLFVKPPSTPLANLDNSDVLGIWTLRVTDRANQDGGTLNGFGLKICLENIVLPVTFLDFTARGRKQDILLNWATEEEINNQGFYVERTTDAASGQWASLGFIAAGTEYSFIDTSVTPNIDYYYRLRQTDFDGTVSYSDIQVARLGGEGPVTALLLFPNPASSNINYRWAVAPEVGEKQEYQLSDSQGRLLMEGPLFSSGGSLQLSSFPSGMYFLRVIGQKEGKTFRIVKR